MTGQSAGRAALVGAVGFVLLLGLLHLLRDDLAPSWRVISEYAVGRHGWLMVVAFLLLAVVSGALAAASWTVGSPRLGRLGAVLMAITAIGMSMAGLFTTDLITVPHDDRTTEGQLHEVGALLDLTPFAAIVVTLAILRGTTATTAARRVLVAAMVAPLAGLAGFAAATATQMPASGVGSPDVLIGWPNRLLIASYCGWYAAVGWYLIRHPTRRFR
jgi:hypothetical protein